MDVSMLLSSTPHRCLPSFPARTLRTVLAALALLPLVVTSDGCDKVPLFAPSSATITLAAGTQNLATFGATDIRAFVVESGGAPVQNGTLVYFSSSLGSLVPNKAETKDGVATVQFLAGETTGQAQISALSGEAKLSAALTITITASGSAVAKIVLIATPGSVSVGGGSVQLTAAVTDAGGNPVVGVPVTFSASAGTLSNSVAQSDLNGQASVTLTTSSQTTVTASAGGATATTVVTVQ
jgi:Bacterial Ig-like domain (group 1)